MSTPQTDRPIFLLGPGRSGTTLALKLVTLHKDIAFFSNWTNRYPQYPHFAALSSLRMPRLEIRGKSFKMLPRPAEAYNIWLHCFPDFWRVNSSPCQDEAGADRLRGIIQGHLKAQRAQRFLTKVTGPPIFSFVRSIFPDAVLVWIDRDPRAVCYSAYVRGATRVPLTLLRRPEQQVSDPSDTSRWIAIPKGVLSASEELAYLAERYLSIYHAVSDSSSANYLLRYEDLIRDPVREISNLLAHAKLEPDPKQMKHIAKWPILKVRNQAWQEHLSARQQNMLTEILEEPLVERGYLRKENAVWTYAGKVMPGSLLGKVHSYGREIVAITNSMAGTPEMASLFPTQSFLPSSRVTRYMEEVMPVKLAIDLKHAITWRSSVTSASYFEPSAPRGAEGAPWIKPDGNNYNLELNSNEAPRLLPVALTMQGDLLDGPFQHRQSQYRVIWATGFAICVPSSLQLASPTKRRADVGGTRRETSSCS